MTRKTRKKTFAKDGRNDCSRPEHRRGASVYLQTSDVRNRVAESPARTVLILDAMAATLHSLSGAEDLFGMTRHVLRHQMQKLRIV